MKKNSFFIVIVFATLLFLNGCDSGKNIVSEKSTSSIEQTIKNETPISSFKYSIRKDENYAGITAFVGNEKDVVIPPKIEGYPVKVITFSAFTNTPIESVAFPDSVKEIWEGAFENCQNLHTVNFGDNINQIGNRAFRKCPKLKNAILPKNLTEIGYEAFFECQSLKEVFIPKTLSKWGMSCFLGCPIEKIVFEDGMKHLGSYACFWGATFTEITIPSSVEQIGEYSFHDNLEKVVFLGDAPKKTGKQPFGTKATVYHKKETVGWDSTSLKEDYKIVLW